MTPYKNETTVSIVPPEIKKPRDFTFGSVAKDLHEKIGTIKKQSHCRPKRCMTYGVQYDHLKELQWFTEDELVTVYTA